MVSRLLKLVALLALCSAAFAQTATSSSTPSSTDVTRWEVSAGYAVTHTNYAFDTPLTYNGFNTGLQLNVTRHFGLAGEVGQQYARLNGATVHDSQVVIGPRIFSQGARFRPFGHVLFGVTAPRDRRDFAGLLGGGLDVVASPHVSVRLVQLDYYLIRSDMNHNGFRYTGGLVFRFGSTR